MAPNHSRLPAITITLLVLSTGGVLGQKKVTAEFTDPATGIVLQRFFGTQSGYGFGIALPTAPATNSFIGQLTFPLNNGAGWGGWSLTGDMEGPLLMAAWSDGTSVVSSFRQAANEKHNPPEVAGNFSVKPISKGTSVNNTFLTYTFLCEGCLGAQFGLDPNANASKGSSAEMGWALSSKPVINPGSSAGVLAFHNVGEGGFKADLALARRPEFDTWAALAGPPVARASGAKPFDTVKGGLAVIVGTKIVAMMTAAMSLTMMTDLKLAWKYSRQHVFLCIN
ncbi:hypothetical protein PG999_009974 [Apiospora kogelbergensis]|uniref:Cellobiose dehydrogenase-like cytochrome domain-containing protein n=1 Tax=Apiospora kogelbergensis TaxID=1337665 RepID=A0AAW0QR77_9PEZI